MCEESIWVEGTACKEQRRIIKHMVSVGVQGAHGRFSREARTWQKIAGEKTGASIGIRRHVNEPCL